MKIDRSETPISYAIVYMWNLRKRHNELLCITDTDSQTLKKLWFPKEIDWGLEDGLGVWDGNAVKLDYDDHCTTINVIKFIEKKKKLGDGRNIKTLSWSSHRGAVVNESD